ncbi:adenylate/guanylate cyclase domain-containing protein [Sphingosinicella terrae]|uniref:adenylate/guanylate cyclase domain-containing protein n=1 Tax=Sphingosinicella terrae TaxID=2172047 RepID=UPI000E0DD9BC|nr:adenylate/guanylate cyclase domain-containing protein [Sphingosinicella terrae]
MALESWREAVRSNFKQVGLVRLLGTLLFLLLGLYLARFAWDVPLASDAERALYDLRSVNTAPRTTEPDQRIVLVTYNDDTLAMLGKRSPLDRAMLADALRAIDGMNPQSIGIDILIDQAQDEDPQLVETMRAMRTPTFLAFASAAHNPEQILPWQEEFLTAFIAQGRPGPVRPASIRLASDGADGVIRRWAAQPPGLPPPLVLAMAGGARGFADHRGAIAFRYPAAGGQDEVPVFTNLPIEFVAQFPDAVRSQIEGRHVLIGGDIQDLDDFETPMTRFTGNWTKGIEVHASLLAQVLDGRRPAAIPGWMLWIAAIGAVAAGGLSALLEWRGWKLALALIFQAGFFGYLPFLFQGMDIDTINLPAFGWGAGWLFAFVGVGTAARAVGSEQRRFAQSALGKYLPPDIANQIMRDPSQLSLHGEKKQIYALFTDLEGFTKLSHAITPEQLSALLNRYLDVMSDVVLEHGGTIDKFVGDAVVAFWGAPIARPDDADRAVRAAIGMYEAGQEFAANAGAAIGADIPPIGRTRVGLHRGDAVVGNFGGEGRMQYTALGDGMNCAARLESANKALKTTILVSSETKRESTFDLFRPMGRIVLSGRATPVEVWEPAPHMDAALRERLCTLWQSYDGGDREALVHLEEIARAHKDDAALSEFVYRIREAGSGGHFVLGSK